jgi:hypothetical protein
MIELQTTNSILPLVGFGVFLIGAFGVVILTRVGKLIWAVALFGVMLLLAGGIFFFATQTTV